MSTLRSHKSFKVEMYVYYLTEGNVKNKHETDVNESIVLDFTQSVCAID
jgi:hypothetical protein